MSGLNSMQHKNRWWGLLFLGISLIVISLDNTVLNVSLPSISRDLGASASDLQWIVDAYILVFAALLLTLGTIGDRAGRKKLLQFGLVIFGLGSLFAAQANSTNMLIAARAFIGIGAAAIMPSTLSLITAMFRDPKERSKAIAVWAGVFGLGVGIGPLVGGWLVESFSWHAVFYINLPIVVVALVGGYFMLPESYDEQAAKPDVPGVILSIIGLFALIYGIIEAGFNGWDADNVVTSLIVGGIFLAIFFWWESRTENALLPVSFFKNMSFTGANLAIALVMFGMMGTMFFFSQYYQSVQGATAFEAGLRVFPLSLFLMLAAALSTRIVEKIGIKFAVGIGILMVGTGLFYFSQILAIDTPYWMIVIGYAIMAFGMGTAMTPATDSIMGSVPLNKAGVGSAMNDTTRQLGGALGIAVLGTLMNNIYLEEVNVLADNPMLAQMPAEIMMAIRNSIQGAHLVVGKIPMPQLATLVADTANQAFVNGITAAMFVGAIIAWVSAVLVFLILPAKIQPAEEIGIPAANIEIAPAAAD